LRARYPTKVMLMKGTFARQRAHNARPYHATYGIAGQARNRSNDVVGTLSTVWGAHNMRPYMRLGVTQL